MKEKEKLKQFEIERKENERLQKEIQELHMKSKAYYIQNKHYEINFLANLIHIRIQIQSVQKK